MRRILSWVAVGAALCVLAGGGVAAWYAYRWWRTPSTPVAAGTVVVIPPGASFRQVVDRLERVGVVRHALLFRILARYQNLDRQVRSGEYRFTEALTPAEVLEKLRSPESLARRVTVPEGLTARQIAVLLESDGFGGRDAFACAMHDATLLLQFSLPATGVEGYLFPDTYAFEWFSQPLDIVRAMLARFVAVSEALGEQRQSAGLSVEEMVILASVIEKETGAAVERPLIAGVFHNRLRRGMLLQSDPTVIYGRDGDWGLPLTRSDLKRPTSYNTYTRAGLPHGPIANPGRAALYAAVAPQDTKALYFVSKNDGTHVFSRTLREHNRAVRTYQRGQREKSKSGRAG
jgi:UPF0755 protein